jgi:hypothetical protein
MLVVAIENMLHKMYLKPEIVRHPTTTTKRKQFPLVFAHAHILQSAVYDF